MKKSTYRYTSIQKLRLFATEYWKPEAQPDVLPWVVPGRGTANENLLYIAGEYKHPNKYKPKNPSVFIYGDQPRMVRSKKPKKFKVKFEELRRYLYHTPNTITESDLRASEDYAYMMCHH